MEQDKIKVFLVEDEMLIRNGIKKSIDWEEEGYCFAGEASDGELAYPMILKVRPDILITDIKMPFMDGLELSRLVKKEIPDVKILILSGYDDFEYAKEAIQIGVTEYMLKPVSSGKLLEALEKVSKSILREREEKEFLRRYSEEMKEHTEHEKMKFFTQLIQGELPMAQVLEQGERYGMNISAQCYQIMLFKVMALSEHDKHPEHVVEACDAIDEIVAVIPYVYEFQRGVDGWAFLLTGEDETQMAEQNRQFAQTLHETMKKWKSVEYFGGVGSCVSRVRNLSLSFREADKAFAARFTHTPNQIVSVSEVQRAQNQEEFEVKGFVEIGKSRELIEKFLNGGTLEEVDSFADAFMEQLEGSHLQSTLMRQYIIMDIHIVIMAFCERLAGNDESMQKEAEELRTVMQNGHSMSEIRKYLVYLLNYAIEMRDTISGRRYSDIMTAAKELIAKEYMTEGISLNTVAVHVGMSPSYFSSIFSKEMGRTFVEYLTETRMEKAKELLMCSSLKTSEIGYQIGYKDPHYFSYIFKKTQGCSPKEYRSRRKE
ncbi:MAG: response regulator [Lachnospiraceae bacterium]